MLKKVYRQEMYLILTIENSELNAKLLNELLEIIPAENIINLYQEKEIDNIPNYSGRGFLLKDFLPKAIEENRQKHEKIKVRINCVFPNIWNMVSRIYTAFQEDSIFDVLLIVDGTWGCQKQAEEYQFRYIMCDDYLGEDNPDILILCSPFAKGKIPEAILDCRNSARLVVVIYWMLINYFDSIQGYWQEVQRFFGVYRPDFYLFDSLLYKELRDADITSDTIVEMGNPKFDGIYYGIQDKKYNEEWEKLNGKKTILWAPTHGFNKSMLPTNAAFDVYAKAFFEYADSNSLMGFIVRLHPVLINEMCNLGLWSQNDVKLLKKYCEESVNIVFDETDTYENSFAIADGILTDSGCGIIYSALPTLKPICITYRTNKNEKRNKDLQEKLYSAYNCDDMINFLDMVKAGKDLMFDQRKAASEMYIKHFDGKNGWRIKEFIKAQYLKKL